MYLAEGENIVNEALRDEDCIDLIVLREDMSSALRQLREKTGKPVQILSSKLFDEVTDTQSAQGILAVVKKRMYDVNDIKDRCTDAANILVLDRLQDPGNIGTVIRTAEACGYGGVICMKGTVEPFSPKVVRAAAGALFRLPTVFLETPQELLDFVRVLGKRLVVSKMDGKLAYFEADLRENVAIVIGNEGSGCSSEITAIADEVVSIPMRGESESLNASVAAAVLMYEAVRGL